MTYFDHPNIGIDCFGVLPSSIYTNCRVMPHTSGKTRNPSSLWERHRRTIVNLYSKDSLALEDIRSFMSEKHGFKASLEAYKQKLRKWKARRPACEDYTRGSEAPEIVQSLTAGVPQQTMAKERISTLPAIAGDHQIVESGRDTAWSAVEGSPCYTMAKNRTSLPLGTGGALPTMEYQSVTASSSTSGGAFRISSPEQDDLTPLITGGRPQELSSYVTNTSPSNMRGGLTPKEAIRRSNFVPPTRSILFLTMIVVYEEQDTGSSCDQNEHVEDYQLSDLCESVFNLGLEIFKLGDDGSLDDLKLSFATRLALCATVKEKHPKFADVATEIVHLKDPQRVLAAFHYLLGAESPLYRNLACAKCHQEQSSANLPLLRPMIAECIKTRGWLFPASSMAMVLTRHYLKNEVELDELMAFIADADIVDRYFGIFIWEQLERLNYIDRNSEESRLRMLDLLIGSFRIVFDRGYEIEFGYSYFDSVLSVYDSLPDIPQREIAKLENLQTLYLTEGSYTDVKDFDIIYSFFLASWYSDQDKKSSTEILSYLEKAKDRFEQLDNICIADFYERKILKLGVHINENLVNKDYKAARLIQAMTYRIALRLIEEEMSE